MEKAFFVRFTVNSRLIWITNLQIRIGNSVKCGEGRFWKVHLIVIFFWWFCLVENRWAVVLLDFLKLRIRYGIRWPVVARGFSARSYFVLNLNRLWTHIFSCWPAFLNDQIWNVGKYILISALEKNKKYIGWISTWFVKDIQFRDTFVNNCVFTWDQLIQTKETAVVKAASCSCCTKSIQATTCGKSQAVNLYADCRRYWTGWIWLNTLILNQVLNSTSFIERARCCVRDWILTDTFSCFVWFYTFDIQGELNCDWNFCLHFCECGKHHIPHRAAWLLPSSAGHVKRVVKYPEKDIILL